MSLEGTAQLPGIEEVTPLSASDEQCLSEIRAVLRRHDALDRFGLTLLHEHFQLEPDETLLETVDTANRALTATAVKRTETADENAIATSWRLDSPGGVPHALSWCVKGGHGQD